MKKINKTIKTLIILTLLTNIFTTPTHAQTPQQTKTQTPPIVDPERLRVNLTETIPKDYMHTNTPETPQQLQFKNMILELTTSRKMTMSITSDEQVQFQYLSMTMEMTQNMHINMYTAQNPPENIPPTVGVNKYLTLEPNATEPIRTTLRLYMDPEELESSQSTDFTLYTWCYWNGTHWDPTPTRYTDDGFLETNTTHLSVWTIKEQPTKKTREIPTPNTPGVHAETKTYNYTDTTPSGFKYKMLENIPVMLQFQNSAIYMHGTNPIDLEYSAEEQNQNRLLRVEVEAGTPLHLKFNLRESKPDDVAKPEKNLGFYYEIEPNQTITKARLGYEVDPMEVQSLGMDTERLSWAFWNGTHWKNVESTLSEEGVLEADTDHFSVWTILELEAPEEPVEEPVVEPEAEEPVDNKIPIPVAFVGIGIFAAIYLMMRKNQ